MTLEIETWPDTPEDLVRIQHELAAVSPDPWTAGEDIPSLAGCWICHPRGREGKGAAGDSCWAAAALIVNGILKAEAAAAGRCPADYQPGLLALREGPLLEASVRRLPKRPDVLLVNATGRDHPRRAGLALHLGAKISVPTVGVTRQPLIADGPQPSDERGAMSLLRIDGEIVACWLRTRYGTNPLVVHPGWRADLETAVEVVLAATGRWRTPEPLRQARRAAREYRRLATPIP